MEYQEALDRLAAISDMLDRELLNPSNLTVAQYNLLTMVSAISKGMEEAVADEKKMIQPKLDHIIISCDASIKQNPGGPSAVGIVIQLTPHNGKPSETVKWHYPSPATTNNQAEYDAIYLGLTGLLRIRPSCTEVEIRSDSQLIIRQLEGTMKCDDPALQKRRDVILETIKDAGIKVKFTWRPRNSTPELKLANFLAQDELGVPRH